MILEAQLLVKLWLVGSSWNLNIKCKKLNFRFIIFIWDWWNENQEIIKKNLYRAS
jgi:hypothetical protein